MFKKKKKINKKTHTHNKTRYTNHVEAGLNIENNTIKSYDFCTPTCGLKGSPVIILNDW